MDTLLHFLFWAVVETIFFRFGRVVLKAATFGSVRLEKPTPFQVFVVAGFGLLVLLLVVVILNWVANGYVPLSA